MRRPIVKYTGQSGRIPGLPLYPLGEMKFRHLSGGALGAITRTTSGAAHQLGSPTPGWLVRIDEQDVPRGLIAVSTGLGGWPSLRLDADPPFALESSVSDHRTLCLTPCPECGATLAWYPTEVAGGRMICRGSEHHHVEVVPQRLLDTKRRASSIAGGGSK